MNVPEELKSLPYVSHSMGVKWDNVRPLAVEVNDWGAKGYLHELRVYLSSHGSPVAGFVWDFPNASGGVMAYPELICGKKPWKDFSTSRLPLPLAECYGLAVDYVTRSEGTGEFNLAFDIWLTNDPRSQDIHITHEVMLWIDNHGSKSPAGRRVADGPVFDTWCVLPGDWGWGNPWSTVSLVYRQPRPSGRIAVGEILGSLATLELIPAKAFVASLELGNEIWSGAGWTVIDKYEVML